jgi:hypothetical protein
VAEMQTKIAEIDNMHIINEIDLILIKSERDIAIGIIEIEKVY